MGDGGLHLVFLIRRYPGRAHPSTLGVLTPGLDAATFADREVILGFDAPHLKTGGLAVLFGNLAPEGAEVKTGAMDTGMRKHSGSARVFDSQDDALRCFLAVQPRSTEATVSRATVIISSKPVWRSSEASLSWVRMLSETVQMARASASCSAARG